MSLGVLDICGRVCIDSGSASLTSHAFPPVDEAKEWQPSTDATKAINQVNFANLEHIATPSKTIVSVDTS